MICRPRMGRFGSVVAFALLVVWKHKANIARLRAGTEPTVGKKTE